MVHIFTIVLTVFVGSVNAAPRPHERETTMEYLTRYENWLDSVSHLDRSWGDLVSLRNSDAWSDAPRSFPTGPDDPAWSSSVAFIESNRGHIGLIHDAASKPHVGVPVDRLTMSDRDPDQVPPSMGILLPHLSMLNRCHDILLFDAIVAAQSGDYERLMEDIKSLFHIHDRLSVTGAVIESMAEIRLRSKFYQLILAGNLRLQGWSNEDLSHLADLLQSSDLRSRVEDAFQSERWQWQEFLRWIFEDSDGERLTLEGAKRFMNLTDMMTTVGGDQFFNERVEGSAAEKRAVLLTQAIKPQSELEDLLSDLYEMQFSEFKQPAHSLTRFEASARVDELAQSAADAMAYSPVLIVYSDYTRVFERLVHAEAEQSVVLCLIQIERYRNEFGRYPKSLDQVPDSISLDSINDPFSAGRLRYKLVDGNPLIYSVGTDRDDDGASPLIDRWGDRVAWPEFIPLNDLESMNDQEREEIDGDWVLYPRAD